MFDLDKWIIENKEEQYCQFQSGIIKSHYHLDGIRVGKLRALAKKLDDNYFSDASYEKLLLSGFVIAYRKTDFNDKKSDIYKYLLCCDDWSLIDSFCSSFSLKDKDKIYDYLSQLKDDPNSYVIRFVLVMELRMFIDDKHIDEIIDYCLNLKREEHEVRMAIGWLLQVASIKYFEKVMAVIEQFDYPIIKIYQRKMLDSYRVDEGKKERVRQICTK
ncbi:MAG: DNA alkylation repair protein [Erysipelotrichaceae bacterium]